MQSKETSKRETRRQYSKPEIRKIALEPQECLAAGCKTLSTSNTGGSSCDLMSCSNLGS
jgi:hypothetical protein